MATHCRILAWRIPGTEEPSELQSMGFQSDATKQLITLLNSSFCFLLLNSREKISSLLIFPELCQIQSQSSGSQGP